MKTLSTLLITTLFVTPAVFAANQDTTQITDQQTISSFMDYSQKTGGGYTWEDPSDKTGGNFAWVDPSEKSGGGYTWEDPSDKTGGSFAWVDPARRAVAAIHGKTLATKPVVALRG
ncbi:hypothetical protein AB4187_00700 [Vibrio breoganii]